MLENDCPARFWLCHARATNPKLAMPRNVRPSLTNVVMQLIGESISAARGIFFFFKEKLKR